MCANTGTDHAPSASSTTTRNYAAPPWYTIVTILGAVRDVRGVFTATKGPLGNTIVCVVTLTIFFVILCSRHPRPLSVSAVRCT